MNTRIVVRMIMVSLVLSASMAVVAVMSTQAAAPVSRHSTTLQSALLVPASNTVSAAPMGDMGALAIAFGGKLLLVLALLYLTARVARATLNKSGGNFWQRLGRGRMSMSADQPSLHVLATLPLAPRRTLHVVEAGHQRFLLASGENGVSLLAALPAGPMAATHLPAVLNDSSEQLASGSLTSSLLTSQTADASPAQPARAAGRNLWRTLNTRATPRVAEPVVASEPAFADTMAALLSAAPSILPPVRTTPRPEPVRPAQVPTAPSTARGTKINGAVAAIQVREAAQRQDTMPAQSRRAMLAAYQPPAQTGQQSQ